MFGLLEWFWNDYYRSDMIYALSFLKPYADTDTLVQKVYEQKISVVMHGDFSVSNICNIASLVEAKNSDCKIAITQDRINGDIYDTGISALNVINVIFTFIKCAM